MSCWTHITSCISVDTNMMENKRILKKLIEDALRRAPKITGSEGNADVFVNVQSGYNWFVNTDCDHCKYKDTIIELGKGEFECSPAKNYTCKSGKYQTCVVISVQGDLRDRTKEKTKEEFENFLNFIKNKYTVRDYSINIEGE